MLACRDSDKDGARARDPLSSGYEESIREYEPPANSLNVELGLDPIADARLSNEVG
jgi:hypothetical protein